jgi:signal recognition particle receptor subunit beta
MAELSESASEVNARVVYWGIEGSGKSTNLGAVYAKLRPDHRSEVREVPTRFDPSVSYEVLPIELGEIAGLRTRLQIIAVPGAPEQAPTRKQLLDRVDGVVLVLDSQPERLDDNLASFQELRRALAAYGRRLDTIPLVVQYNKRDLADAYAAESLHRKLDLGPVPVFEAVATQGRGVLETLSTISKRVIRSLRDQDLQPPSPAPARKPEPEPEPPRPQPAPARPAARMEEAILREPSEPEAERAARQLETVLDTPAWEQVAGEIERPVGVRLGRDLSIVSVGPASRSGERRVRVPLVLGDASGQTTSIALSIEIEPLVDEDP